MIVSTWRVSSNEAICIIFQSLMTEFLISFLLHNMFGLISVKRQDSAGNRRRHQTPEGTIYESSCSYLRRSRDIGKYVEWRVDVEWSRGIDSNWSQFLLPAEWLIFLIQKMNQIIVKVLHAISSQINSFILGFFAQISQS